MCGGMESLPVWPEARVGILRRATRIADGGGMQSGKRDGGRDTTTRGDHEDHFLNKRTNT